MHLINKMDIVLPPDSKLYRAFQQIIRQRRIVFFAGLPGVGKSLLLKQLGLMAHKAGRVVDSLQWDVTRAAFETDEILARYPELDGVTHAAIRKAVGLWARQGIAQWQREYPDLQQHMLIGEVPLIGNRLIELGQKQDDEAEGVLNSMETLFVIPVPSKEIRQVIEAARSRSIAQPRHEREAADAAPNVLQMLWHDVYHLAHRLGIVGEIADGPIPYTPDVYSEIFQYLLQHRHYEVLPIDTALSVSGSAYDLDIINRELAATPNEVKQIMTDIKQQYTEAQLKQDVAQWYRI